GISLPNREDMRYIVDCFRLHKIIQALSESLEWSFLESAVSKLVDSGERLSNLILGHPGYGYPFPERASSEIRRTTAEEHPAARAWQELQPGRGAPESIDTLREAEKSAVYRLTGVGPG